MNNILQIKNLSKSFPGVQALDQVDFNLNEGEVVGVLGENGAGKSTLMKIIFGLHQADSGEIIYRGVPVVINNPYMALSIGISMIHQELSLIPEMSVSENVWLGRERQFLSFGLVNKKAMVLATEELFARLGINVNTQALAKNLSIANLQLIEIARAVSYSSNIIIMDEPTSALTEDEIQTLYKIIRDLKSRGVSIIFITHKLEEVQEICDRVMIMRDGKHIATRECVDLTREEIITMIVGRELKEIFPKSKAEITDVLFEVKGLTKTGVFSSVSFNVRKGEILGFSGLMGSGRTEIMRAIFGIDKYDSGEIWIDGKPVKINNPGEAIKHGISMVNEDRLRQGVIHRISVRDNLSIAYLNKIKTWFGLVREKKERIDCLDQIDQFNISLVSLSQLVALLSGGNQQKVIISRWLLTNPRILILDEPTRGIDVGTKAEVHRKMSELARQGLAIILVSSEMPEILGMSDRIIVVRDGRLVYECSRSEADQELLMDHAFGLKERQYQYAA